VTEPASCKNKSKLNEMLFNGINQSRYLIECPNFTDLSTGKEEGRNIPTNFVKSVHRIILKE
jgi:hypothetical protein